MAVKTFGNGGQNGKLNIGGAAENFLVILITLFMPFPMKIQPIDSHTPEDCKPVKPVVKSRLKRLFERQFLNVLRNSAAEKVGVEEPHFYKDGCNGSSVEFEPSSVCLAKMVQSFIEENNEKQSGASRCGRNRCNCFNRNSTDSSEDDFDSHNDSNYSCCTEACEILKVKKLI